MEFINEVLDQEIIDRLKGEMDAVLEQFKTLIAFTMLHEGVLDNLPQDPNSNDPQEQTDYLIQKISMIQKRVNAVASARNILGKLEKSGGFSKDKVKDHKARITKNNKSLSAALKRVKRMMTDFTQTVELELKKTKSVAKDNTANPQSDVDIRAFGRLAPFVLRKATSGSVDDLDPEKYGETVQIFKSEGLINQQGNITDKGEAVWASYQAKKNNKRPNRDAIDDLADMGAQSNTQSDLDAFG
jgi:Sec-independent protein translocase protein TatA